MSNTILEGAIIKLVREEPFYASMLLRMQKTITKELPTLAISVTNKINLYINPDFFEAATQEDRVKYLKHEILHVVFSHIQRSMQFNYNKEMFNVAADIAINQLIPNFPDTAKISGEVGQLATYNNMLQKHPNALPMETADYYYELLQQDQQGGQGESSQCLDDHGKWEDSVDSELVDTILKKAVNAAAEDAKIAGNLPAELEKIIDKMSATKNNWKRILRKFVANTAEILVEKSRKKRNRRYGVIFPGDKKECKLHLAIAIDTSASVSDNELNLFFGEIQSIYNNNVKITIIECDCQVQQVYDYSPNKEITVHGRGGTLYQPAIDRATELDIDGLIYMGDMEIFNEVLKKPKFPVLWAIVGNSDRPVGWGWKIKVE